MRVDRVAIAQSMRILSVVVLAPFLFMYSGVHGADTYAPATSALDWERLGILLAIAAAGAGVLALAHAPNAFMLGALFSVIGLTVREVSLSSMLSVVSNIGQLLIGCALGLAAALGASLAWTYRLPVPSGLLATAPGGIAEMCITAKVLRPGVLLVTAAHVTRLIVLVAGTGPMFGSPRAVADGYRTR